MGSSSVVEREAVNFFVVSSNLAFSALGIKCYGSTADSKPVSLGSTPRISAKVVWPRG